MAPHRFSEASDFPLHSVTMPLGTDEYKRFDVSLPRTDGLELPPQRLGSESL